MFSILTDLEGKTLVEASHLHHVHLPYANIPRQFVSNKAKFKATEDFSARPLKIVRKKVQVAPAEIRVKLSRKDLLRARRNSYISRRSVHPRLPQEIF